MPRRRNLRWETVSRALTARLRNDDILGVAGFFLSAHEAYRSPEEGWTREPGEIKLLRSLVALQTRIGDQSLLEQLRNLRNTFHATESSCLPTLGEFRTTIAAPFQSATMMWPHIQSGLSFGSPVALPSVPSLNLVFRYFDESLKLKLKLKIGLFKDDGGGLMWETGCILTDRSLGSISKDLSLMDSVSPVTPHMLKHSTEAIVAAMHGRLQLSALDLTPAFYHIVPASLWLGGTFVDRSQFEESKRSLFTAIEHSLCNEGDRMKAIHAPLYACASQMMSSGRPKDIVVSLLLYNRMLFSPKDGSVLVWKQPRMIRYRGGAARTR